MRYLIFAISVIVAAVMAASSHAASTVCTGTITGSHESIIVPDGASCVLRDGSVTGNVTIESAGNFEAQRSTIGGFVLGWSSPTSVNLWSTTVFGVIVYRANSFNMLESTVQGLLLVDGSILAIANDNKLSGLAAITNNGISQVSRNSYSGILWCSGNRSHSGSGNIGSGYNNCG